MCKNYASLQILPSLFAFLTRASTVTSLHYCFVLPRWYLAQLQDVTEQPKDCCLRFSPPTTGINVGNTDMLASVSLNMSLELIWRSLRIIWDTCHRRCWIIVFFFSSIFIYSVGLRFSKTVLFKIIEVFYLSILRSLFYCLGKEAYYFFIES